MPLPNGCALVGAAFNPLAFSTGFNIGGMVCGPYYDAGQDLYTPGADAAQVSQPKVASDIFTAVAAEDERI